MNFIEINAVIDKDVNDMLEVLTNFCASDDGVLKAIDAYLYKQKLLDKFEYEVNGRRICPYSEFNLDDESDEDLRECEDYIFVTIYALFVKWMITNDNKTYKKFLRLFEEEYLTGWIYPVDDKIYWQDQYCRFDNLNVDSRLKYWVIYIERFLEVNQKYMKMYLSKNAIDKKITIFDNSNCNNNMNVLGIMTLNYVSSYQQSHNGIKPSSEIYYRETRNINKEGELSTGGYAVWALTNNIEVISMIKIILKKKCAENDDYKVLLKELYQLAEKCVDILYDYQYEYEMESYVSDIPTKAAAFRTKYVLKLTSNLMNYIANNNIEELLQCKKDILPIFKSTDQGLTEQIEENLQEISKKLVALISKEESMNNMKEKLIDSISNVYVKLQIPDDIIDTLATAEYLFNEYIYDKKPIEGWDYSFVSILYYQVLEKSLNHYVYQPYLKNVRSKVSEKNVAEYFGHARCFTLDRKRGIINFKDSVELGPLGFLLQSVKDENNYISCFLKSKYPAIKIQNVCSFGEKILEVSKRRNNAAHANVVKFNEAKKDKYIVYCDNNDFDAYMKLRDLINDLFKMLV